MDIRKLQRAIVDGLEDVKAHNIVVFNTEHLSPLFERVIVASGTSNRQTKALASSVRETVKERGLPVLSVEGDDNGEWIIVDCGAAVAHIMQPAIRDYYHLEEIWGDKPVKMKIDGEARRGRPRRPARPARRRRTRGEEGRCRPRSRPPRRSPRGPAGARKTAKPPARKSRRAFALKRRRAPCACSSRPSASASRPGRAMRTTSSPNVFRPDCRLELVEVKAEPRSGGKTAAQMMAAEAARLSRRRAATRAPRGAR